MTGKRLAIKRTDLFKTLLYAAILVMGILFIIDNSFVLKISFYVVGGAVTATAVYMLIKLIADKNRLERYNSLQSNSFFRIFLIVIMMVSGVSIIVYSNQGVSFYQGILASVFFFRSVYRFFYAYLSKKAKNKRATAIFLVLAIAGLALSAFFTFYDPLADNNSTKAVGIVAGITVILEGLYGLYRMWLPAVRKKIKIKDGGNRTPPPYQNNSGSEIVITDYEIVDDNKN